MNSVPAQPTFLGAWRGVWSLTWRRHLAWRQLGGVAAQILAIPTLALFTLDAGETRAYFNWLVDFYLVLIVPLSCLFTCGGMIREELQNDTLGFLTSRPVTRTRLFLSFYLSHMAWLQLITTANLFLFLLVGWIRGIQGVFLAVLLVWGVQILAVAAYSALSALLGLIHTRFMVLGILYGFVVEIGIGRIPTNINALALSHHVTTLLANNPMLKDLYRWLPERSALSILIMLVATGVFLTASALLFTFREYLQSQEVQK